MSSEQHHFRFDADYNTSTPPTHHNSGAISSVAREDQSHLGFMDPTDMACAEALMAMESLSNDDNKSCILTIWFTDVPE